MAKHYQHAGRAEDVGALGATRCRAYGAIASEGSVTCPFCLAAVAAEDVWAPPADVEAPFEAWAPANRMTNFNAPEPPPSAGVGPSVWAVVISDLQATGREDVSQVILDMRQRERTGRAKYGVSLRAHNGRDAVVDAYQETLDAVVYLKQAILEALDAGNLRRWTRLNDAYREQVTLAVAVRGLLSEDPDEAA